ncbi:MAG: hypothetical protein ACI8RZ_000862 [Myxococcota bacterium]|jgi:hypothetical protein
MRTLPLILLLACDGKTEDGEQSTTTDPTTDWEADADTDSDTDADTDADTDSDTDADTDADTDSDTDADTDADTDEDPQYTYNADIAPIVATSCTDYGCHLIATSPNALTLDVAYNNMLTEPSEDIPTMARIAPGSPDDSYVWHKINNTHLDLKDGAGESMPKGYALMTDEELAMIEAWITQGALEK